MTLNIYRKTMSPTEKWSKWDDKLKIAAKKRNVVNRFDERVNIQIIVKDWSSHGGYHIFLNPDKQSVLLYGPRNLCYTCESLLEHFSNMSSMEKASVNIKEKFFECSRRKFSFLKKCDSRGNCSSENLLHNIKCYDIFRYYIIYSPYDFYDLDELDRRKYL